MVVDVKANMGTLRWLVQRPLQVAMGRGLATWVFWVCDAFERTRRQLNLHMVKQEPERC